jgi:transposase-like protein
VLVGGLTAWPAIAVTKILCPHCLKEDDASTNTLRRQNVTTYRCPYCGKAFTPEQFGEALSELAAEAIRVNNMDAEGYSELVDLREFHKSVMTAGRKVPEKE